MIKKQKENLTARAPVVVILGHVDHGKTTILDFIRKTKVADKESGGITQHIGAYEIEKDGKKITFIDTPGHEAFSAMRGRGAQTADIAILVIAAEEGIKPQTKEAIEHIKKAAIPMIIAINKVDKPEANSAKVKRALIEQEIIVEEMGGNIPSVEVSGKTGKGIEELLEMINLIAEMGNLKGDLSLPGQGVVIESYMDSFRGPTATLLLRDGVLNQGDIIGTKSSFGKAKMVLDFQGKQIKQAFPSQPVVVLGFELTPQVGETFKIFANIEEAQQNLEKEEKKSMTEEAFLLGPDQKVLNIILKADVQGSLEAIEEIFKTLPQEKIVLRILKKEVGDINESDVKLAASSKAKIVGFRIKKGKIASDIEEQLKVKAVVFDIIYELVQSVRFLMEKLVSPEDVKNIIGRMKILGIFHKEGSRKTIGGKVVEGEIRQGLKTEILRPASNASRSDAGRNDEKIGEGRIINLQRNKKDTDGVAKGEECGILYEFSGDIQEGDILIAFVEEKLKGEL